jgi:hypothetical protein
MIAIDIIKTGYTLNKIKRTVGRRIYHKDGALLALALEYKIYDYPAKKKIPGYA